MGALVHFNMMTYGGCSPDAATFNPVALDTDQGGNLIDWQFFGPLFGPLFRLVFGIFFTLFI